MLLTIDPPRTALLLLDYQHDNITATPGTPRPASSSTAPACWTRRAGAGCA